MSTPRDLENPLWAYTLKVYQYSNFRGWAQTLWHHYGMDSSLLLACGYAASQQCLLRKEDFDQILVICREFHEAYQNRLGALRQKISHDPEMTEALSQTWAELLAKTELQAEQVQQASLYSVLGWRPLAGLPQAQSLAKNLKNYAVALGFNPDRDPRLVAELQAVEEELCRSGRHDKAR
ncbi:MAG: DUF2390 domain-containing protein [Pseudomonadales bacterium]|nr:DUF2390 domain-containing protein [Pseudomonadales bacterium]